ncbi:MAG TPA: hypothetical protein PKK48_00585 [Phycisphaerae bacterium]|nr:hypothetical protein [Phycisphaerae bacterium]HPS52093.1 hypothetical protein [Phycisphaerae bacterium]
MKKSSTNIGRRKGAKTHKFDDKSSSNSAEHNASANNLSAPHAARKGITSAKKLPGHPVRKVDARSLHRILTWSIELSQRQQQLMDAAIEILANAKND